MQFPRAYLDRYLQRASSWLSHHPSARRILAWGLAVTRAQSVQRTSLSAAAVAFWAVLAVTPVFIALTLVFGRFLSPQQVSSTVTDLKDAAPSSLGDVLSAQLQAASSSSLSTVSWGLAVSLVTVLWAVSTGVYTFSRAVRLAYDHPPSQYVATRVFSFLGAFATVLVLGVLLLVSAAFSTWAASLDAPVATAAFAAQVVVGVVVLSGVLWVFFRLSAPGSRVYWPGAVFGAVATLAVVVGYGVYLQFASSFEAMYGALASTVLLSVITYVASYAVLLGAVGNAQWRPHPATPK